MESDNLLNKLERVERSINIYGNVDKKLIEEISIDIPIEVLRDIIKSSDRRDSMLYLGYVLDRQRLEEINNKLGEVIQPDFNKYYYVLECTGIYNW